MSSKSSMSIGKILLQFALGAMLSVAGIWALQGNGEPCVNTIRNIFNGDLGDFLAIVFGIIEIISGIFLLVELFAHSKFGNIKNIFCLIIIVVWILVIVLSDFLAKGGLLNGFNSNNFLGWIYSFSTHLIVLGALLSLD